MINVCYLRKHYLICLSQIYKSDNLKNKTLFDTLIFTLYISLIVQ